ncbi:MAG: hypothetical protein IT372_36705 [Polyangiaceae bacterium]|nr:hypothetical protein [Polyangiaceae bacterium]
MPARRALVLRVDRERDAPADKRRGWFNAWSSSFGSSGVCQSWNRV